MGSSARPIQGGGDWRGGEGRGRELVETGRADPIEELQDEEVSVDELKLRAEVIPSYLDIITDQLKLRRLELDVGLITLH